MKTRNIWMLALIVIFYGSSVRLTFAEESGSVHSALTVRPNLTMDKTLGFVQITCVPEFDYFSVRTTNIFRDNHKQISVGEMDKTLSRLESKSGLFTSGSLLEKPYECNLPTRLVKVEIENYIAPHSTGECGNIENFDIGILVNGEKVDAFSAFGYNRCTAGETHLADLGMVWPNGEQFSLQDCTFGQFEDRMSCKSTSVAFEPRVNQFDLK